MGRHVRHVQHDDIDAVVELLVALFGQERDFTPEPHRHRRALELLLEAPDQGSMLVLEDDGVVVGSVMVLRSISTALGAEVCWLEDVVARSDRRGQGIGSLLLDAAIAEIDRLGLRRISVLTDQDNTVARRLYESRGFRRSMMTVLRNHR